MSFFKKIGLAGIVFVIAVVSTIGSLGFAQPAYAGLPVTVSADVVATTFKIKDEILEGLKVAVQAAAGTVVSYVLRKVAYDSAVWLASGGKGQSPFAQTKSFGDYLKNVGNDALGHGIEELSKGAGFNLCSIPDPKLDLAMKVGLRVNLPGGSTSDPTSKPACTFTDFQKNWSADAWKSKFSSTAGSIEQQFNAAFQVDQTGLGIQLAASSKINQQAAKAVGAADSERIANQGFVDKKTSISGDIQLPAPLIAEEFKATGNARQVEKSGDQISAAINSGNYKNLPGALSNFFLSTLAGTVLKNFQQKGVLPFGLCIGGVGGESCTEINTSVTGYADSGVFGGRRQAEQLFNGFLAVHTSTVNEYDIAGQLSSCPDAAGLYNCRADSGLIQAAQEIGNGNPTTIQEAIDRGWLHGEFKLIPPSRAEDNADKNCYLRAYCYSNLKVLRQARILPLGFEIAAAKSDPDQPWTLAQVVKGFNDCNYLRDPQGKVVGVSYDPVTKPFCHLIDPDWVIKVPAARCNAVGFGPNLLSADAPNRLEECTDLSTCVAYNSDGTCSSYGYCAREKNIWRFNADSCDAQYRTCRSFVDASGAQRAYVYRSLDTSSCTKDTVGCAAYSLSQDKNGQWQDPTGPDSAAGYVNNGVFFNNKVSTACSANSAGCSAFKLASTNGVAAPNDLYLKKAPDYLGCYDSDPSTRAIDWATTVADLARITPSASCKNYAGACIPDEVSCNWYTPSQGGGGKIPGKFKAAEVIDKQIVWNDQCDAKCVGYASYREMPSTYSVGQDLAYIIPASGSTCTAQEEGCSSFTNLSTTLGQVENVEHYSYLRPCATPDSGRQKNFITYEGATVGGYQLKVFSLVSDETGGPQYFYRTETDAQNYDRVCSEALYKAGTADPDCRQFNDDAGKIYYRLLAKTIPVSNSCTPYRLNNSELTATTYDQATCTAKKGFWNNNQCQICLQGGEYKNGSCFYYGLPDGVQNTAGVSKSCQASANTCRAYKGNAGNNIREVFNDTFEGNNSVLASWKPAGLQISNESTRVGEHSLANTPGTVLNRDIALVPSKSYDLTFWAKGDPQSLSVSLVSSAGNYSKDFGSVGVGDTWNYYHLGPIEYGGAGLTGQLAFKSQSLGKLYLDNIRLVEVTGYVYLVKNSLKVDPVCDSSPNDNLPGEALGCMEYKDPSNRTFTLTGFNYLCREGAIGCSALYDTQNTPSDAGPKAYNVWLAGGSGTKAEIKLGADTVSCQIPVGQAGCYVNIAGHAASEILQVAGVNAFVKSTVYIPADTLPATPVYLVANQAASCTVADLGCTYAGVQKQTPTGLAYTTALIKNDPASYETALCQRESVGCSAFASGSGDAYFKDPLITGQKICTYQSEVTVNGVKSSGWFWKGVGVCSTDKNTYCSANSDCGGGGRCQAVGAQPCYPDYLQQGSAYGLWSYGDGAKYKNFVGECPVAQDKCTQFVDHHDNDRSYYYIKNEKISGADCNGSVSQKKGCALFDEIDNPTKIWSSAATYAASQDAQDALTKAVEGTPESPADANSIIKVDHDRTCGEWLQCRSSHRVWDDKAGRWKVVCDDIGRCDRAAQSQEEGSITNCTNWIEGNGADAGQILTPELYTERETSWAGMDYTGWSIPGIFPIEELSQVNVSAKKTEPQYRLVRRLACGNTNCVNPASPTEITCKQNDAACGQGGQGMCLNGLCVQNPDGSTKDLLQNAPAQTCRLYPEKDSPFPNTSAIGKAIGRFNGATFCSETKGTDGFTADGVLAGACDCNYTKVSYGDGALTKYWSYQKPNSLDLQAVPESNGGVPQDICQGGTDDGVACTDDSRCQMAGKSPGTCQKKRRTEQLLGWKGFCLENDGSRVVNAQQGSFACLSWFPVDSIIGASDINEQDAKTGYQSPADLGGDSGRLYCLAGNTSGGATDDFKKDYPETRYYRKFDKDLFFGTYSKYEDTETQQTRDFGDPETTCLGDHYDGDTFIGIFNRDRFAAGAAGNIKQTDIEKIIFQVGDIRDSHNPSTGAVFEIWPNDSTPGGTPQAVYVTKDHSNAPGITVTGKYLGKNNEFILMYASQKGGDGQFLDEKGNVCMGDNGTATALCGGFFNSATYKGWDGTCAELSGNILKPVKDEGLYSRQKEVGNGSLPMGPEGLWNVDFDNPSICDIHAGHGGKWHAVRVKFNDQGKFAGFDVAACQGYEFKHDSFIKYKVTFKLREWCSTVADTTINHGADSDRVIPWTNRLWQKSKYEISSGYSNGTDLIGLLFNYTTPVAPFGSLQDTKISANGPFILTQFDSKKSVGGADNTENCPSGGFSSCTYTGSVVKGDPATPILTPGAPYSCTGENGVTCVRSDSAGKQYNVGSALKSLDEAKNALGSLFSRVPGGFDFNFQTGNYNSFNPQLLSIDKSATGDWQKKPRAPLIFPVGPCDSEGHCLELQSRPGFTIDNEAQGKDIIRRSSSAKINLQFFMAVDSDQMPVRQVNIFWGDGKSTLPGEQAGRNYRGYLQPVCRKSTGTCVVNEIQDISCSNDTDCTKAPSGVPGSTCLLPDDPKNPVGKCVVPRDLKNACTSNVDCSAYEPMCAPENNAVSFGRIAEKTCVSNYRLFDHVYFCSNGGPGYKPADQCPANMPNGCCVFVPKVQVIDNWGWCNGTCRAEAGGGCYNDPKGDQQCQQFGNMIASTPFANKVILAAPAAGSK